MSRLGPGLIVLITWAQSFGGQRNKDNTREERTQHSWKRQQRRWVVPTTY